MALYGCQLWHFESVFVDKFYVAWRKCCWHLLDIPYKTYSDLVHLLCEDDDVDIFFYCHKTMLYTFTITQTLKINRLI